MTRKNLPIALYLLLVFGSGAVVGGLGYRTYNPPTARSVSAPLPPPPAEWRRQYIEESKARLSLTADQVQQLTTILDQTDARFREIREHDNQMIRKIREEHFERVRTILTADQIPKYEKLHAEREAKAKDQEQHKR
jgi:hypothetical protein